MTDETEVERIAEGVARGIKKAEMEQWYLEALAAANEPAPPVWFAIIFLLLVIGGFWWLA